MIGSFGSLSNFLKVDPLLFGNVADKVIRPSHAWLRSSVDSDNGVVSEILRKRDFSILLEGTILGEFLVRGLFVSKDVERIVVASQIDDWILNLVYNRRVGFPFFGVLIRAVFIRGFGVC